jgi:hypothetical protein
MPRPRHHEVSSPLTVTRQLDGPGLVVAVLKGEDLLTLVDRPLRALSRPLPSSARPAATAG